MYPVLWNSYPISDSMVRLSYESTFTSIIAHISATFPSAVRSRFASEFPSLFLLRIPPSIISFASLVCPKTFRFVSEMFLLTPLSPDRCLCPFLLWPLLRSCPFVFPFLRVLFSCLSLSLLGPLPLVLRTLLFAI